MSVTHPPSYQLRPGNRSRNSVGGVELDALEVELQPDRVTFKYVQENSTPQLITLWTSGVVFMLFVVSVIPAMNLDAIGNALAVLIGMVALAAVGIAVQARTRSSSVDLSPQGIRVDEGTSLDREVSEITWPELASVEIEPVDPKDESKGVHLEFKPAEGEPIRALAGLGVGDLNAVRQAVLKARRGTVA